MLEPKSSESEMARWRDSLSAVTTNLATNVEAALRTPPNESAEQEEATPAKKVGRATLHLLAQPFQQLKGSPKREENEPSVADVLAGLDYAHLNMEARKEMARARPRLPRFSPWDRAWWAAGLWASHGAALVAVLGWEAASRLAWPLAVLAPCAWLAASSRNDSNGVWPEPSLGEVFPTLGMLDAAKRRLGKRRPEKTAATAGASMQRASEPGQAMRWEPTESTRFVLRGPNYLKDKKKHPSPPALYEPFGVDLLRTSEPVFCMPGRVRLPERRDHERALPSWLPRIIVQTMYFPGRPPSLVPGVDHRKRQTDPTDPKGWEVVCYWRVTADAAALARDEDPERWPPHLKLWKQYVQLAETMPVLNGCLKGVASVDNIHDEALGLPRLVKQYNAKPVLMAATALVGERPGVVKVHRDDDYFEFALDVGNDFAAMSNHVLFSMRPTFPKLVLDIGWLVEGRASNELPEGLVACLRINKVDLDLALDIDDFFAGKTAPSPNSALGENS